MEKLDAAVKELYRHLRDKTCLCDIDEAGDHDELMRGISALKSWLMRGGENAQVVVLDKLDEDTLGSNMMEKRDILLLCFSISKQLFEATHCAHVLHLQLEMVDSGSLLVELGTLMSSADRLTAFMTCQMATAVLSSPAIDKEKAVSFLHHHLSIETVIQHAGQHGQILGKVNFPIQYTHNSSTDHGQKERNQVTPIEVSAGQIGPDQVNLNPDDPGQVRKGHLESGQMSSQSYLGWHHSNVSKNKPYLPVEQSEVNHAVFTFDLCRLLLKKNCDEGSGQVTSEITGITEGNHQPSCKQVAHSIADTGRLKDCQKELEHLLFRDLPCILRKFASPLPADEPHRVNIASNDIVTTDITLILASLLDLVHTLLKQKNAEQHWQGFISKLGLSLMHLIKDYCHDVIILKRLLDVLVLFMDHSAMTSSHSIHHLAATLNDAFITTAATFVSMIGKRDFLENIPFRIGPVGFGGGNFHHSRDNLEDESGDRPLLRKLYRATMCAVKTLLVTHNSTRNYEESDVESCLQILWDYICCKLNCIIPAEAHIWLVFELFSEQDDSLVWVMHCSLDLYKAFQSPCSSCSLLATQLNPHRIFHRFLDTLAYDPSVLLDLLISSETPFLEYLVSYLHAILRNWDLFFCSLQEVTPVDSLSSQAQNSSDMASSKPFDDKKQNCESSHSCCEQEEDVKSIAKTKRRKTEGDGGIDQETWSPKSELDYTSSTQATSSPAGVTNCSCKAGKRTDAANIKRVPTCTQESLSISPNQRTLELLRSQTNMVSQPLDDVMTTLIRLRFSIERISGSDLFPYPITPLLRLLKRVEGLYEGNTHEGF